jgi:hypothetical protein
VSFVVFEKIVRPAQLGDIAPAKTLPLATSGIASAGNSTTLTYGKGGSAKIMLGSQTIDQTYYAVKKPREVKKTT